MEPTDTLPDLTTDMVKLSMTWPPDQDPPTEFDVKDAIAEALGYDPVTITVSQPRYRPDTLVVTVVDVVD